MRNYNVITEEEFKKSMPKAMRGRINTEVMVKINDAINDPSASESLRENLIGYNHVMRDGKFTIPEYINAVKYVSYKVMGTTNTEAYIKTFPSKYANFKLLGVDDKTISRYIVAYNKSKLVNLIFEQSLVPTHVLNADVFQQAINIQAELMLDQDVSPKVRSDAANSLLTHLKRPEAQKIELDIGVKDDKVIDDLRNSVQALVNQQSKMIDGGNMSVKEVAHSDLIIEDGEIVED